MEIDLEIITCIIPLLSLVISIFSNFWIVKIKNENIKELENLKQSFQQEIEKLKSELEKERMEFNHQLELEKIRSSGIYHKRMEAIIAINSKIIDVYRSLERYVSFLKINCESCEDDRKQAVEKIRIFWREYNSSRILLPEEVDKMITGFISELQNKGLSFMIDVEYSHYDNKTVDDWNKINSEVCNLWEKLFRDIGGEFRKILGVNQG